MSGQLRKRSRDEEILQDSPKRFHGVTEQSLEHSDFAENFQEENRPASEEAVCADFKEENGVMPSFASEPRFSGSSSEDNFLSGIDLCFLLGASDDELGIPPTPVFQGKGGFPSGDEEDSGFASNISENADLQDFFLENWRFEDNFVDRTEFSLIEESVWDDIASQGLFVDGDCYRSWELETADFYNEGGYGQLQMQDGLPCNLSQE